MMDDVPSWDVLLGLVAVALSSFYLQAVITEERFVPALNVIANHFNIPDDVAGATLMAAGASSSNVFSSFIALFITKSSLGMGTIVGSEMFQQLVVVAGSILSARNSKLELNPYRITREIVFYLLALVLLLFAVSDSAPALDDDASGASHIYVSYFDSLMLMVAYVFYVIVCAYYDFFTVKIFGRPMEYTSSPENHHSAEEVETTRGVSDDASEMSESIRKREIMLSPMPFLQTIQFEPRQNFVESPKSRSVSLPPDIPSYAAFGCDPCCAVATGTCMDTFDSQKDWELSMSESIAEEVNIVSILKTEKRRRKKKNSRLLSFFSVSEKNKAPSRLHNLSDIETDKFGTTISCFLWQRSIYYDKAGVDINAWQLRWFRFEQSNMSAVPDCVRSEKHRISYPPFHGADIDENHLLIKLRTHRSIPGGRPIVLLAPTRDVLEAVVVHCEKLMDFWTNTREDHDTYSGDNFVTKKLDDLERVPLLISFPFGRSYFDILLYFCAFPLKLLIHLSVPDVRRSNICSSSSTSSYYYPSVYLALLSILSSILWLMISCYAMVVSLEALGRIMNISDSTMGMTISAAGTSIPILVASQVAARQGLGNMAVSNAVGSNTFCILVGLGLPWNAYTTTYGTEYHGLVDEDITESIVLLVCVCLIFVAIIWASGWMLYRWHAYMFLFMYAAYILQVIF